MKKKTLTAISIIAIASLIACGGGEKNNEQNVDSSDAGQEIKEELEEVSIEAATAIDSLSNDIDSAANKVDDLLESL